MLWFGSLRRGMEREGTHQKGLAFLCEAGDFAVGGEVPRNLGGFQDSLEVGSGRDAQGAVGFVAVVQMESDGEQLRQYGFRRPCVVDAFLDARKVEIIGSHGTGEREHQILMPGDFPVGGRSFVESDGLDGHGSLTEMTGRDERLLELDCGFPDERLVEQASLSGAIFLKQGFLKRVQDLFMNIRLNTLEAF